MDRQPPVVVLALGQRGLGLRDRRAKMPVVSLRVFPFKDDLTASQETHVQERLDR